KFARNWTVRRVLRVGGCAGGWFVTFNQLVAASFPFFPASLLPGGSEALEQVRNLLFLAGLLKRLNQAIESGLISGGNLERFTALFDGFARLTIIEIQSG